MILSGLEKNGLNKNFLCPKQLNAEFYDNLIVHMHFKLQFCVLIHENVIVQVIMKSSFLGPIKCKLKKNLNYDERA